MMYITLLCSNCAMLLAPVIRYWASERQGYSEVSRKFLQGLDLELTFGAQFRGLVSELSFGRKFWSLVLELIFVT